ncbi:hypothetical protein LWC34_31515 [Kibdelosporangium philippinense]|uniref:Uncharacterized protein n=1 Tax=Kibdelosporangium philippinense TaxID=211113 RepID=A0ABS8ZL19_9PSEU|nr:hypothetical protein [Kibdelosporangium philippinense]
MFRLGEPRPVFAEVPDFADGSTLTDSVLVFAFVVVVMTSTFCGPSALGAAISVLGAVSLSGVVLAVVISLAWLSSVAGSAFGAMFVFVVVAVCCDCSVLALLTSVFLSAATTSTLGAVTPNWSPRYSPSEVWSSLGSKSIRVSVSRSS